MAARALKAVLCLVFSACLVFFGAKPGWATTDKLKVKANAPKEEKGDVHSPMTPEQADSYVAGLSDEETRRMLLEKLSQESRADSQSMPELLRQEPGLVKLFYGVEEALGTLSDKLTKMFKDANAGWVTSSHVWLRMTGGTGGEQVLRTLLLIALIILCGVSAERIFLSAWRKLGSRMLDVVPGRLQRLGTALFRLLVEATGIFIYMAVTFLLYLAVFGRGTKATLASSSLIVSYYFRLTVLVARRITSPDDPRIRPVPMSDADARYLYHWIILISASVLPTAVASLALRKAGAGRELLLLTYSTAGPLVSLLLILMILRSRKRVARAICPSTDAAQTLPLSLAARCAGVWHYLAAAYVLAIGVFWWVRVLTHEDVTIMKLIFSLFLIPACIGIDWWGQRMLTLASGEHREVIDLSPTPSEVLPEQPDRDGEPISSPFQNRRGKDLRLYLPLARKAFRAVLVIFFLFATMELWGIELDTGWLFARSAVGIFVLAALGLVLWEVARARIDQTLREEMPLLSGEAEEGGSGGSRKATLLMLLRKFTLVVLLVIFSFSILSSIGVNIGPLLAGAGVVGLAIGFGAQTLVKDIISGVFFLVDDAFRVGDYVEAGTAKGTVERISLRSLTLRHPRGQVFTLPFGDLKQVTNFTRDYIIEKLDIRVRFDTDPEAIRKIVKAINKDMKQDEEYKRVLLSDIKSAGVRTMDDSAMIMRVKFKCIPGEQFIVRRQVYQRLRKAFQEQGIEFAHRNVTVYLPPQPTPGSGPPGPAEDKRILEAAGAAAAAIEQADAQKALEQAGKK